MYPRHSTPTKAMPSEPLDALLEGIAEVRHLQSANPILPGKLPNKPLVVRAVNRASVVLLSSYLERYLRSINEEASRVVNASEISGFDLPLLVRLRHSQSPIDDIFTTQWDYRKDKLTEFLRSDGWLWIPGKQGELDHVRLLRWMRSPSPERIRRLFALWGVLDIFSSVTRRPHTRKRMWLQITELVEKRNAIAHGDLEADATSRDIKSYISVVICFCKRADGVLSQQLARICREERPW